MDKYLVHMASSASVLQRWLNEQAQHGYKPVLIAGAPGDQVNRHSEYCIILEHDGSEKAKKAE